MELLVLLSLLCQLTAENKIICFFAVVVFCSFLNINLLCTRPASDADLPYVHTHTAVCKHGLTSLSSPVHCGVDLHFLATAKKILRLISPERSCKSTAEQENMPVRGQEETSGKRGRRKASKDEAPPPPPFDCAPYQVGTLHPVSRPVG